MKLRELCPRLKRLAKAEGVTPPNTTGARRHLALDFRPDPPLRPSFSRSLQPVRNEEIRNEEIMSVVSTSSSDLQILIISGDVPTRQLLASGLETPSRVHVTTTADGAGAISLLSSARYRIVILALPVVARELLLDDMV